MCLPSSFNSPTYISPFHFFLYMCLRRRLTPKPSSILWQNFWFFPLLQKHQSVLQFFKKMRDHKKPLNQNKNSLCVWKCVFLCNDTVYFWKLDPNIFYQIFKKAQEHSLCLHKEIGGPPIYMLKVFSTCQALHHQHHKKWVLWKSTICLSQFFLDYGTLKKHSKNVVWGVKALCHGIALCQGKGGRF
jgi:hypothetical protein